MKYSPIKVIFPLNSLAQVLLYVMVIGVLTYSLGACVYSNPKMGATHMYGVENEWNYADLRLLDPVDADGPNQDLLAVYTRFIDCVFEVRLDLFDIAMDKDFAFYLAFDVRQGGNLSLPATQDKTDLEWDYLVLVEPGKDIHFYDDRFHQISNAQVGLIVDRAYDFIQIRFGSFFFEICKQQFPIGLQVFMLEPELETSVYYIIKDKSNVISSGQLPPPPLEVSFVFWNVFTAQTPAEALRQWDGAHAGPMSSRHGMKTLVELAQSYKIPVLINGLDTQMAWSVWDYMRVGSVVRYLVVIGLLDFSYFDVGLLLSSGYAKFVGLDRSLPTELPTQKFLKDVYDFEIGRILLGGDFSTSSWGDPFISIKIADYLAAHPWISFVRFSPPDHPTSPDVSTDQALLLQEIQKLPDNPIKLAALHMYHQLTTNPNTPEDLIEGQSQRTLNQSYLPYIRHFFPAAEWASSNREINSCAEDWDRDGVPECVLATDTLFAIIQLRGGYIPILFAKVNGEIHQIIGPSYQFASGLGDPSCWFRQQGIGADPGVMPGALFDGDYLSYIPYPTYRGVTMIRSDMAIRKTIFMESDLILNLQVSTPNISYLQIPLALDPWRRFSSDWTDPYRVMSETNRWTWEIQNTARVSVSSNQTVFGQSFLDSQNLLIFPEDPNYDFPAGHYLPIPMALIKLHATENTTIQIEIGQ